MTTHSELRVLAEKATPGPWVPLDMEAKTGDRVNPNGFGWWWVWRETERPYYAGVMESAGEFSVKGTDGRLYHVKGAIGEGMTTDGATEQDEADVRYIAAVSPDVVLGLLNEIQGEYDRGYRAGFDEGVRAGYENGRADRGMWEGL